MLSIRSRCRLVLVHKLTSTQSNHAKTNKIVNLVCQVDGSSDDFRNSIGGLCRIPAQGHRHESELHNPVASTPYVRASYGLLLINKTPPICRPGRVNKTGHYPRGVI